MKKFISASVMGLGLLAVLATSPWAQAGQTSKANKRAMPAQMLPAISEARVRAHIKTLASDFFEGRGPGTRGDYMATSYVAGAFAAMGLEPAGKDGSWFQDFDLTRYATAADATFSVGDSVWTQGSDVVMVSRRSDGGDPSLIDAPLVFAGYGVVAPERGWNDYAGIDMRGKIAIVLVNDPDFEAAQGEAVAGRFGGKAMTWYGRWPYKYDAAAAAGAAGVLIVHEDAPASYGWGVIQSSFGTRFDYVRADKGASLAQIEGWMRGAVAAELLSKSGYDLQALKRQARTPGFRPILLNQTASARLNVARQTINTRNVVGVLKGKSRPEESVIFGAHHDHLGVRQPINGDGIYNGAVDNASGVAGMLEIARTLAEGPRPDRSIVFASWAAEEEGLLGSDYYVNNPLFPLAKTAAAFTVDGLSHNGRTRDMTVSGLGKTTLDSSLRAIMAAQGRTLSPDPNPQAGTFYRSDHFPFARAGVPALFPSSGGIFVRGGRAAGDAAERDYVTKRYHQPSDEYNPAWDLSGALEDLSATRALISEVANARTWPQWTRGDEFEGLRKSSDGQRR